MKKFLTIIVLSFSTPLFAQSAKEIKSSVINGNNIQTEAFAQNSNPELLKRGYMDGNTIQISFQNDGAISGNNLDEDVRGVWNGYEYISDLTFLIGLELPIKDYTNDGIPDTIHSVIIPRGPRRGHYDERHPTEDYFWGFNPLPGYMSDDSESPAMSNKPNTWPINWADHPEWGEGLWNGLYGPNNFSGDLETFFVVDDFFDDEFNSQYGFYPNPADTSFKGHGITVAVRYIQSNNPLYDNLIFKIYDLKNNSVHNYEKMFWGNITGTMLGGDGDSQDDLSDLDQENNIVLAWDADGLGIDGHKVGVIGESIIAGPNSGKIKIYEYFPGSNSPDLSNDEYLWQRFSKIVTPYPFPMDGDHLYGSDYFSLTPGETKRIVSVLGISYSKDEVIQSIMLSEALWNSGFNYEAVNSIVTLNNLDSHKFINGVENIEWESGIIGGKCDIWFSLDFGSTWEIVEKGIPNNGSYSWNTSTVGDCYFGKLKIFIKNADGNIVGFDESNFITINNEENGNPQLKILTDQFDSTNYIVEDNIKLEFYAGDSDNLELNLNAKYSSDNGATFIPITEFPIQSRPNLQNINLNISTLPNSISAIILLELSDGNSKTIISTPEFQKNTVRENVTNDKIEYLSGFSEYPFDINIVNQLELTGDEYLITFNDTTEHDQIFINVFNLTKQEDLLMNSPIYEGNESEVFDGLSFRSDQLYTQIDSANSNWKINNVENVLVIMKRFSAQKREGYAIPNNYEIEFYDEIVDTSVADTLYPPFDYNIVNPKPANFKVKNLYTDENINFVYRKVNSELTSTYNIWFKEKVGDKILRTWSTVFRTIAPDTALTNGNIFSLVTKKGFSIYDTIKVLSLPVSVNEGMPITSEFNLSQNYPNPFNPTTTIKYSIPKVVDAKFASTTTKVTLKVYDLLGREVRTLVNQNQSTGEYQVGFNASSLSSGIYFYRLHAGEYLETKKMILLR